MSYFVPIVKLSELPNSLPWFDDMTIKEIFVYTRSNEFNENLLIDYLSTKLPTYIDIFIEQAGIEGISKGLIKRIQEL